MTEVQRRVGRRGAVLALIGTVYALIGVSYLTSPLTGTQRTVFNLLPGGLANVDLWGWVYVIVGASAVFAAFWPPGRDWWGFFLLMGLSTFWTIVYIIAAVRGVDGAAIGFLRQAFAIAVLAIISGWREPRVVSP